MHLASIIITEFHVLFPGIIVAILLILSVSILILTLELIFAICYRRLHRVQGKLSVCYLIGSMITHAIFMAIILFA